MIDIFQSLKRGNSLPMSNLFIGPSQSKSTLKTLASVILCDQGDDDQCLSCRLAAQSQHPDLISIDATVSINEIKEILKTLTLPPYLSRTKVCIVTALSKANKQVLNSLLKTLEEPPSFLVFLLHAENQESLPATVLSRCVVWHLQNGVEDVISSIQREIAAATADLNGAEEFVKRIELGLDVFIKKKNIVSLVSLFEEAQKKQRRQLFNLIYLIILKRFSLDPCPELADLVAKFQMSLYPLERRYLNESAVFVSALLSTVDETWSAYS
ncbi:MAG: hypothetical protein QXL01_06135 [Thermoplasmatales archaeon]